MPQNTPGFVLQRAEKEIKRAKILYEQAKKRVPEKYQDFLVLLDQKPRMFSKVFEVDDQARTLGIWTSEKGTYVNVQLPYVTVDGRVQMARDEHKEAGKTLNILPPKMDDTGKILTVTVESELYGTASGSCMINMGGRGVDQTNPVENAETSAIGRALGFLGYGLIGTGIASAEEIEMLQNGPSSSAPSTSKSKDQPVDPPNPSSPQPISGNAMGERTYVLKSYESKQSPSGIVYAQITVSDTESNQDHVVLAQGEEAVQLSGQIPEEQPFKMGIEKRDDFLFLTSVNGQTAAERQGAA